MTKALLISTTLVLSFLAVELLTIENAHADNAIGVVLGSPTGASGRFGLNDGHSIEGAVAYAFGEWDGLEVHGTYLWDHARTFGTKEGPIEMYYGLGARLIMINSGKHDGEVAVGPRAPIGLLYNFHNPNIEVFAELSATLDIAPKTDVDLDAGIGFRVRF
ncbi:hypothetical protein [Bdellovibrio sp. NC01]|uniref:hypothetical protein n=1 Tax=Bdellovibrio sp. NC01 TaxID=2220073 RepID=UPI0011576E10|nr:hypothetical protein [Bdellovibrio sp. NC01]QDK37524.1 hypothetical protein DOE51_07965 [Bdellovibrio sp. NC01]